MLSRRRFLSATAGSPLFALASTAPGFIARTARAAPAAGKDTVLVVIEMTGGNDGLNTVVPHADDLYHKARPTLRLTKEQVVRVDDHVGLNPGLRPLEPMLRAGEVAVVQGVGYPNPDRSHFESMDVWQSGDPKRLTDGRDGGRRVGLNSGWLGRGLGGLKFGPGAVPGAHVGPGALPLALAGSAAGVPSLHPSRPYELELDTRPAANGSAERFRGPDEPAAGADPRQAVRRALIEELAGLPMGPGTLAVGDLQPFVRRSQLQTYANVERLRKIVEQDLDAERSGRGFRAGSGAALARDLALVGRMINADFGTRVFYVSVNGFDTHANQLRPHEQLLNQVAGAVAGLFAQLRPAGNADRVLAVTFSEFGRRVAENGSKGTDHGAGSCLFVVGPAARGGPVGKHPSLSDLDAGDLKHHTDFRSVYAALLDGWLGCDSRPVLGGTFAPAGVLKPGPGAGPSRP